MPAQRPLSNWQMFNINFGYLGIQFAWALQFANISGVFKFLGADDSQIPILWLAGPVTGLLIPPVIGFLSDKTWVGYLGRRRIYILAGCLLAVISLLLIPHSQTLTQALILVWLLDSSLNMAMHPYRALIADSTPIYQQTKCFSFLTIASCFGSALAFIFPWLLAYTFLYNNEPDRLTIPFSIEAAFFIGAFILFITSLWTVLTTQENYKKTVKTTEYIGSKPDELKTTFIHRIKQRFTMPDVMHDLIKVEFFSWIGLFTFIIYFALGIAQNLFDLPENVNVSANPVYTTMLQKGVEYCGLFSFFYILISTVFASILSKLANKYQRKNIYAICLFLGGIGLIICSNSYSYRMMLMGVILLGLAWGAVVTLPFAILSSGVPNDKVGWYMGYYNLFVVIPQLIVSCFFGYIIRVFFHDHAMSLICLGGFSLIVAAVMALKIRDPHTINNALTVGKTSRKQEVIYNN